MEYVDLAGQAEGEIRRVGQGRPAAAYNPAEWAAD